MKKEPNKLSVRQNLNATESKPRLISTSRAKCERSKSPAFH
jgi:hypothetical protein